MLYEYFSILLHVICVHFLFRHLTCNLISQTSLSNINFKEPDDVHTYLSKHVVHQWLKIQNEF
jgi:hypothetical protein